LESNATAAEIKHVRAILQPATERRPAPEFTLKDSSGETAKLTDYRGKVVLVDFWATWCEGCKEEIPWFSEFQETNGTKSLAVIGVSMDEGGWPVVKLQTPRIFVKFQECSEVHLFSEFLQVAIVNLDQPGCLGTSRESR
jgi:thiol-disulfide isomerase/thioredoxin